MCVLCVRVCSVCVCMRVNVCASVLLCIAYVYPCTHVCLRVYVCVFMCLFACVRASEWTCAYMRL